MLNACVAGLVKCNLAGVTGVTGCGVLLANMGRVFAGVYQYSDEFYTTLTSDGDVDDDEQIRQSSNVDKIYFQVSKLLVTINVKNLGSHLKHRCPPD